MQAFALLTFFGAVAVIGYYGWSAFKRETRR